MEFLILIAACIINLSLGIFVLIQDPKTGFARSFGMMSLAICIWTLANYFTDNTSVDLLVNDFTNKTAYVFAYGIVLSGLLFTYYFPVKRKVKSVEVGIITVLSIIVIMLSATTLVAGDVSTDNFGTRQFSTGPMLWLYAIAFLGVLVLIARNVLVNLSHLKEKARRAQARIVLIAFSLSAITGLLLSVIIPLLINNWYTARLGPLATVVLVVLIVYAIARHGLFDVRLVVVRSLGYVLSIGTLALVYFALAYLVSVVFFKNNTTSGVSISPINIGLSLVLAFAFQPIKRFFDKVTNFLFYRDVYNVEEFFARLTKRLSIITNLDVLLRYSSSEISNTLKASFGAFYIHQIGKDSVYVSTSEKGKRLPKEDVQILDAYVLDNHREIVITEELADKSTRGLKRMLDSHHIALSLPITKDSIISGYLFLGEHLSSQYSIRDIRALLTIADELMIAIQNALSVQEIRALNDSLQHRVDVATKELRASNAMLRRLDKSKDDFISMASHQLRTPLTSIKGYISMVREGDVGKITKTQDELLGEAFTSSERMVHLINDFLNVSRLQTGKFLIDKHPVDLAKVIEQELDSLATNAKSRKLSFVYKAPKKFPILNLDEDKMRQVIMNFSDNAIYYSKEGTKIKVQLAVQGKNALFTVTDTGIGVPRAEQSQLFNKFYRASNARRQRPDGTGVGLYLAKKVIDAHDGKVIFESVEGKGSTFGFKLPLDELRA